MSTEEVVFLNADNAKVTSARAVIGGKTFAMAGITSVEAKKVLPKRSYLSGLLAILVGLAVMSNKGSMDVGIAIAAFGGILIWWQMSKTVSYSLMIRTAGGEQNALTSDDEKVIDVIASAITDAIVHRG